MGDLCKWHDPAEGRRRVATAEDWAWLADQGERAWGEGFLSRYNAVCWEHDRCEPCDGRGRVYEEREDEVAEVVCGDCAGDGAHHRDCGRPASYCDCEVDGG